MARIIVGSYMIRYPLGGMLSWTLQWLVGLKRLGHEVFFVEKGNYDYSCYDPVSKKTGNDCSYGVKTVVELFDRFGLDDGWCFVDPPGEYHGLSAEKLAETFRSADLFLDLGTHGAWLPEAQACGLRVLVDGEPGYTQMKMANKAPTEESHDHYDFYFSNGANIGSSRSDAPDAGKSWRSVFNPVVSELFQQEEPPDGAPFTTVMNWQSHQELNYKGRVYGQKDVEFARFIELPGLVSAPLEVAASGKKIPQAELQAAGWRVRDGEEVSRTFDSYRDYIRCSRAEFSVCKNVFVETNSGWFSDRSAAYLASGRPVVLQETGFSEHLPTGEGLFAVRSVEEAQSAIDEITRNYEDHSAKAVEIARDCLEAKVVLSKFLDELGF